ncbi:hypothetical protein BHM03_00016007 [Ensete ventricosum]|nr:hypothetical protein BHM03_00016007 [Ensete ventricosum]
MRLGTHLECIRNLLRVSRACQDGAREFTGRRPTLVRRLSGVAKGLPGAATARPEKRVKVVVRKHKSRRDEGSSHAATQGKEPATPSEDDLSPAYRPKSMNDLCRTRVHKDDEGYYNSQAASEFGRRVLHPYLAKDLYILPSKILMAQAAKQIVLQAVRRVRVGPTPNGSGLIRVRVSGHPGSFSGSVSRPGSHTNPFTEKPNDSSMPMKTRQEFDNSLPPEE